MASKENYIFTIQGDLTPYQRKLIAVKMMKIADHYDLGMGVVDARTGDELDWDEMMDTKYHKHESEY